MKVDFIQFTTAGMIRQAEYDLMHSKFVWRPTDVLIASYPRSGNTWVRMVISHLQAQAEQLYWDPSTISWLCPDIYLNYWDLTETNQEPRFIKTHSGWLPPLQAAGKFVYVIRDGRDAAVSYCRYLLGELGQFSEFLRAIVLGAGGMFPPWHLHVESWQTAAASLDPSRFLFIQYEELKAAPYKSFQRIAAFLGLDVTREQISTAVNDCKFEKLKAWEQAAPDNCRAVLPIDHGGPFFRRGMLSEWAEVFSHDELRLFESTCKPLLAELGY